MTLVALGVYFVLAYVPEKVLNNRRYIFLVIVVIAAGVAILCIYLNLYRSGYTAIVLGKTIYTGREYLWAIVLERLGHSRMEFLLGAGARATEGLNLHNNYLGILFNFGIVGLLIYYLFYFTIFTKCSKLTQDKEIKRGLAMFVSFFLVLGWTETTTLWAPMFIGMNLGIGTAYNKAITYLNNNARL